MKAMVMDHDKTVAMFKQYARSGKDPDLKSWVEKTLPTLEQHQQMARTTLSNLGKSASKS